MILKVWIVALALAVSISICYFYIDIPLASYLYGEKNQLITFADILTYCGEGVYYIVPSLILYIFFRKRNNYYAQISLFILATTSISGILVNILKIIFARFRPTMFFNEKMYGFEWFRISSDIASFPSGHSATALGAWLAFALMFPKYRIVLLCIGVMIASTRVITIAHYLSDVIAGSALGIVVTLIYYQRVYSKNQTLK